MDIVMPRLSDTMEEGTILHWLKEEGEHVARGEELVEIETDKATMTYESDAEGTLAIVAMAGETLAVGTVIARVGAAEGDGLDGPASRPAVDGLEAPGAGDGVAGDALAADTRPPEVPSQEPHGDRVKASPLARRIARERGVQLSALHGTGPGGRIVRSDVEEAPATPSGRGDPSAQPVATQSRPAPVSTAKGETTVVELTRTQQTIARRMAESKATIPDFSLQVDIDMGACVALRTQLKTLARGEEAEHAPTYNDMIVKACALALREHPMVNGSYRDGRAELHSRVNVGVAVATDGALIVPTVFDADTKALGEITRETRALAERVRDGSVTPPELGGGTFTVSNLGMFGVSAFTAIINPPQAAILTVGALEQRAVAGGAPPAEGALGTVEIRPMLTLTLVCDHRILYGADAARFMARVRELLQAPAALTL